MELSIKGLLSFLILALTATGVAAGCGGSGDAAEGGPGTYTVGGKTYTVEAGTTVNPTAPLPKPRFVVHFNALCRQSWKTIGENFSVFSAMQETRGGPQQRFAEAVQLSVLPGIDFHIFDEIHLFGAPKGQKRQVEELLGTLQAGVEHAEKLQIVSAAELLPLFETYNQRAHQYGLDACIVSKAHLGKIAADA
jgi:hypothetical protein